MQACEWFITVFDKNKELWTELGPAVTANIGHEGNSRSIRRVLPKIPARSYGGWDSKIGRV